MTYRESAPIQSLQATLLSTNVTIDASAKVIRQGDER